MHDYHENNDLPKRNINGACGEYSSINNYHYTIIEIQLNGTVTTWNGSSMPNGIDNFTLNSAWEMGKEKDEAKNDSANFWMIFTVFFDLIFV